MKLIGGKFRVIEELQPGGWGRIVKVEDMGDNVEKVLKIAENEDEERFLIREFSMLSRLRHPNIVSVYDLYRYPEVGTFYSMEHLDGHKLPDAIEPRKLNSKKVYELFIQLFRALGYLHSRNIVHGDINPTNIIVQKIIDSLGIVRHRAKLYDFGLARTLIEIGSTAIPRLTGNLPYMPPEMHSGMAMGKAGDLYSLGVVMYEAVTGINPFRQKSIKETVESVLTKQALPARKVNEEVPIRMSKLIEKLMCKEANLRYQTADEVVRELLTPTKSSMVRAEDLTLCESPLVGRDRELQLLKNGLADAQHGAFRVIGVRGELGIGRRRLLREFHTEAQVQGAFVYLGSQRGAGGSAYQALRAIMQRLVVDCGEDGRRFYEENRLLLGRILPKLFYDTSQSDDEPVYASESEQNRYLLYDRILRFMVQCARSTRLNDTTVLPNVLIFENLDLIDPETRNFLSFVIERLNLEHARAPQDFNAPLMIIVGLEKDQPYPLSSEDAIEWLDLDPLSQESAETMAKFILETDLLPVDLAKKLMPLTRGIPLFIEDLLFTIVHDRVLVRTQGRWRLMGDADKVLKAPLSLERFIQSRVTGLSAAEKELLAYAAILKAGFTAEDLNAVSNDTLSDTQGLLKRLQDLHILECQLAGGELRWFFGFAQLQSLLYEQISAEFRVQGHKRAARYYEMRAEKNPIDDHYQLAYHYLKAGNRDRGSEYALLAGQQAEKALSFQVAITFYQQALELLTDGGLKQQFEVIMRIADILVKQSRFQEVWEWYEKAELLLKNRKFPMARICELYRRMGWIRLRQGKFAEAEELLEKALRMIPDWYQYREGVAARIEMANLIYTTQRLDLALSYCLETYDTYKWEGDEYELRKLYLLMGMIYHTKRDWGQAKDYYEKTLALFDPKLYPSEIGRLYTNLGNINVMQGDYDLARTNYQNALDILKRTDDVYTLVMTLKGYAVQLRRMGDIAEAERKLAQATDLVDKVKDPQLQIQILISAADLASMQAHHESAQDYYHRALALTRSINDERNTSIILGNLAILEERLGKLDDALAHFKESLKLKEAHDSKIGIAKIYTNMALVYTDGGDYETGVRLLEQAVAIFREQEAEHLGDLALSLIYLGQIRLEQQRIREAEECAVQAREKAEKGKLVFTKASALHLMGKVCLAKRETDRAIDFLYEALRLFGEVKDTYNQSLVYLSLGELSLAKGDYDRALRAALAARSNFHTLKDVIREERAAKLLDQITANRQTPGAQSDGVNLLEVVSKIARILKTMDRTEDLLESILDQALSFVGAERGIIFLKNNSDNNYYATVHRNLDRQTIEELSYSSGIIQETIRHKAMVFSDDARNDQRFKDYQSINSLNILSLCCAPMTVEDEVLGVIYLDTRRHLNLFTDRDRNFLNSFADLAAAFIIKSNFYQQQQKEFLNLRQTVEQKYKFHNLIVGRSSAMQMIFKKLETMSVHEHPVLITGEQGTGKSLLARAIHLNSLRKEEAYHVINCAALSGNLLESELFGRASAENLNTFTHKSAFELARNGTLVLDEICELQKDLQLKLLIALEQGIIPGDAPAEPYPKHNVRIIATSSKELEWEVQQSRFRPDLFFYLNLITINLPPLRERADDISLLATEFLHKFRDEYKKDIDGFSQDALACLENYTWPGNIRELENAIKYAVLFGKVRMIRRRDFPKNLLATKAFDEKINHDDLRTLAEIESEHIKKVFQRCKGKKVEACEILGLSRPTLDRKLKVFGIKA